MLMVMVMSSIFGNRRLIGGCISVPETRRTNPRPSPLWFLPGHSQHQIAISIHPGQGGSVRTYWPPLLSPSVCTAIKFLFQTFFGSLIVFFTASEPQNHIECTERFGKYFANIYKIFRVIKGYSFLSVVKTRN